MHNYLDRHRSFPRPFFLFIFQAMLSWTLCVDFHGKKYDLGCPQKWTTCLCLFKVGCKNSSLDWKSIDFDSKNWKWTGKMIVLMWHLPSMLIFNLLMEKEFQRVAFATSLIPCDFWWLKLARYVLPKVCCKIFPLTKFFLRMPEIINSLIWQSFNYC